MFNNPQNETGGNGIVEGDDSTMRKETVQPRAMRGRPHPMPRFNTTYLTGINPGKNSVQTPDPALGTNYQYAGMDNGLPGNYQIEMPDLAPVMLACILMPPCKKTKLFFRMRVRTWLEFTEVRPIQEITSFASLNNQYAPLVYHSDYVEQSSKMDNTTDLVDTKNAAIQKIMEGR